MATIKNKFDNILQPLVKRFKFGRRRQSVMYGIPFLLFIVGGSFGLKEWTQIRYQFSKTKCVTKEEAEKQGLRLSKKLTLEEVYEDIQKLDIDNWENKRGPRPWEDNVDTTSKQ